MNVACDLSELLCCASVIEHYLKRCCVFNFVRENSCCREMENSPDMLHQAKKRLHSERKWLALRLREVYTDEEREELFERWGILQMKERKKALSLRLWDPMVLP